MALGLQPQQQQVLLPTTDPLHRLAFGDVYAAAGWHPHHRLLAQLLANASASAASHGGGGSVDVASLAAALLGHLAAAGDAGEGGDAGGPVDISWVGLALAAAVIGVNGLISAWLRLGLHGKLAVGTVRCGRRVAGVGWAVGQGA